MVLLALRKFYFKLITLKLVGFSFSSGISLDRDRITVCANKAKSVESLPVNLDCSNDNGIIRDSYTSRTHSVSSDNVTIKMAAAAASHRKQQSLDNVRTIRLENGNFY